MWVMQLITTHLKCINNAACYIKGANKRACQHPVWKKPRTDSSPLLRLFHTHRVDVGLGCFFFCGTGIFKIRLSFWAKANLGWAAQLTRTLNMRLKSFDNPDDEINEFSTAQLSKLLVSCTLTPRGNRYDPWLCSQAAEKPLLLDLYFTHSKLYRQTLIKTSVWVCACSHTWLARRRESYDERTTWSECDNRRF